MSKDEILKNLQADIRLRGLSKYTENDYVYKVRLFMDYYDKPADQMGEPEIREYLLYLKDTKKLSNGSVNTYNSALRFLYGVTLNTTLNLWQVPRLKQNRSLPQLLTRAELQAIFDNAPNLMYRAMFMTIYGSGLRISDAINLRVCDIDSEKMRLFIREGKGGRDRYATLSQRCLETLRAYWKAYKPTDYIFLTRLGKPPSAHSVNNAFHSAMSKSGIIKEATIHTLRHCFATHLLENDVNLFHIKKLLGHLSIRSTTWYLHFANNAAFNVTSPLDDNGDKR